MASKKKQQTDDVRYTYRDEVDLMTQDLVQALIEDGTYEDGEELTEWRRVGTKTVSIKRELV